MINKIKQDLLQARKDRNKEISTILSTVIGEIETIQSRDRTKELKDADIIRLIDKSIEALQETIKIKGTCDKSSFEISILQKYVPTKLTEEELIKIKEENGFTSPKEMMPFLVKNYAGQYDGKLASKVASGK